MNYDEKDTTIVIEQEIKEIRDERDDEMIESHEADL